jgi:hypothetical protein
LSGCSRLRATPTEVVKCIPSVKKKKIPSKTRSNRVAVLASPSRSPSAPLRSGSLATEFPSPTPPSRALHPSRALPPSASRHQALAQSSARVVPQSSRRRVCAPPRRARAAASALPHRRLALEEGSIQRHIARRDHVILPQASKAG